MAKQRRCEPAVEIEEWATLHIPRSMTPPGDANGDDEIMALAKEMGQADLASEYLGKADATSKATESPKPPEAKAAEEKDTTDGKPSENPEATEAGNSLAKMADEWHRLDKGSADFTWRRARLSWKIHLEHEREKAIRRDAGGKAVSLAAFLKDRCKIDGNARSTYDEDVLSMRAVYAADLQDVELPHRSRNAFLRLGQTLQRGLELAKSKADPSQLDAKKAAVTKAVIGVAKQIANGELEIKKAEDAARTMVNEVLGIKEPIGKPKVSDKNEGEVRKTGQYSTKEFVGLVADAYAKAKKEVVGLIQVKFPKWLKQSAVNALSSPRLHSAVSETFPENGDLWIQFEPSKGKVKDNENESKKEGGKNA